MPTLSTYLGNSMPAFSCGHNPSGQALDPDFRQSRPTQNLTLPALWVPLPSNRSLAEAHPNQCHRLGWDGLAPLQSDP